MAEEASTAPVAEAPAPAAPTTVTELPSDATNDETVAEAKQDEETAREETAVEAPAAAADTTAVAEEPTAGDPTLAESQGSNNKRRKSGGGVPEHKAKKLNKKKSMLELHLDCKPGEMYWARLKGYPSWPSIICDEQMLPESLLASRPVSTARPDGSLRDDFKEGGKSEKDRTYPVMFLFTNEFQWMINTSLTPLDPEQCKDAGKKGKMSKALIGAYEVASQNHDLAYFKDILKQWQEEEARLEKEWREEEERLSKIAEEEAILAATEAKKADGEAKKAKKSRKSKGGDGDVDMEDADAPKSVKKRKKDLESDAEGKPKKTPKVTKLNAPKTPNGDASAKKSATKTKKKVVQAPKEEEEVEKEHLTEEQELERREKAILYLRHRLQKGFLARDQVPQEAEMDAMAGFFVQLESHENLEPSIIRATKIHKVLKAIVKLSSIPKEEQYNFKKRSTDLLEVWNRRMEAEGGDVPQSATEPKGPMTLPVAAAEPKKEEPAATNGEAAPTVEETEAKIEDQAEEKPVEGRAEEAVKDLDQKMEDAVPQEEPKPAEPAVPEVKHVEMSGAVPDETAVKPAEAPVEATTTETA